MKRWVKVSARPWMMGLLVVLGLIVVGCNSSNNAQGASPPTTQVAFVLTTDFTTGSFSVVDLTTRQAFKDLALGGVDSDAAPARFFNGRIYVVNRFGADNLQVIDPQQGYATVAQASVGNRTNPQDIAFVDAAKAYVSRYQSTALLIINPTTLAAIGQIDLSPLVRADDLDGRPEMAHMLLYNGLLYVALQHIDFTTPFPFAKAPGEIVVIDPTTDVVVQTIPLRGTNPFSALQFSTALNRILISSVGDFGVNDGGIEAIDPATNTVDPDFVIDEASLGGDITHFEVVSATKGFAIVTDANFASRLVSFNPSTGEKLATLAGPLDAFVPHFAINSRHELYLAVTDTTSPTPGLRIFDTVEDTELTSTPLNVGLPPSYVLFIE